MKRSQELSGAEISHELRVRNLGIKEEIGEVLTPVINDAADRVEEFITGIGPEMVHDVANARYAIDGPLAYSVATLPPMLFINNDDTPRIFYTEEEVDQHMAMFRYTHRSFVENHLDDIPQYYDSKQGTFWHDVWSDELKSRLRETIDARAWDDYVDTFARQLTRGYANLDLVSARIARRANREFNEKHGIHIAARDRLPTFLLSKTASLSSPVVAWNQLPIGEYGPTHTARTMLAGNFIVDFLSRDTQLTADLQKIGASDALRYHTLRARDVHVNRGSLVDSNRDLIEEGVLAVGAARNFLTPHLVLPYMHRTDQLEQTITDRRLVNKLTLVAGLSLIGSSMFYGHSMPDILQLDPVDVAHPERFQRQLGFNAHALERLAIMREISARAIYDEWQYYETHGRDLGELPPVRTGLGCPFALAYGERESAINRLDRLLFTARKHISVMPGRQSLPETPVRHLPPIPEHARMLRANPGQFML